MIKLNRMVLYFFIFTVPFQKSIIIPYLGSLNKFVGFLLVITAIITVFSNKNVKKIPFAFIMLFLFLILNISSLYWGASLSDGINKTILYIQLIFIFWTIYEFINTKNEAQNIMKAFVFGCLVIALQALYSNLSGGATSGVESSRFFLDGYNPNALGIIWVFGMVISIYLSFNVSRNYFISLPLFLYLIFLTGSRTALILTIILALATIWYIVHFKVRYRITILVFLTVATVFVYTLIPQAQLERLGTISNEFASRDLNGRIAIWKSGISALKENPIFGVGVGSFQEVNAMYSQSEIEMSSHNSYLTILVENGIFGSLIFFAFLFSLAIYAWKTQIDKKLRWLSLTLIILWLILSFASHAEAQKYTWVIFGIVLSNFYIDRKQLWENKISSHD
ncbi:O-antigen ligase family protein [Salinicoccus roseus]|uniref:O-antigen ligase family protein n=1 Tax=Salinicoccus roseus TaxID=45670 RepID=UPI00356B4131